MGCTHQHQWQQQQQRQHQQQQQQQHQQQQQQQQFTSCCNTATVTTKVPNTTQYDTMVLRTINAVVNIQQTSY